MEMYLHPSEETCIYKRSVPCQSDINEAIRTIFPPMVTCDISSCIHADRHTGGGHDQAHNMAEIVDLSLRRWILEIGITPGGRFKLGQVGPESEISHIQEPTYRVMAGRQ
jgi:hypothetical protein